MNLSTSACNDIDWDIERLYAISKYVTRKETLVFLVIIINDTALSVSRNS